MNPDPISKIDPEKVRNRYNQIGTIWAQNDKWHQYTHERISQFLSKFFLKRPTRDRKLLNAGSGGNAWGLENIDQLHVDIAERKINHLPNSLVSSIESMPVGPAMFDYCLCVGSVINYCDAAATIHELHRVIKTGGYLIIEFESSRTFEFIFSSTFGKSATIAETFYQESPEIIWVYSESYITRLLQNSGFKIHSADRFHVLSPAVYRIVKNSNFASKFTVLDTISRKIPFLKWFAANVILSCEKIL